MGYGKRVTDVLRQLGIRHRTFFNVPPDPTLACIHEALEEIRVGGWTVGPPTALAALLWSRRLAAVL